MEKYNYVRAEASDEDKFSIRQCVVLVIAALTAVALLSMAYIGLIHHGFLTCKPRKYKNTLVEKMWQPVGNEEVMRLINEMVPVGTSVEELKNVLSRQSMPLVISTEYEYMEVPGGDYVISFQVGDFCLLGNYTWYYGAWIRDDLVHESTFRVERSFF